MIEQMVRAFRAAAEAAETHGNEYIAGPLYRCAVLVKGAPEGPLRAWSAALAALLRELAPEPGSELAEAERVVREYATGGRLLQPANVLAAAVDLLNEYDRRGAAEVHERARAQHAIDESMRRGGQIADLQNELFELRAARDRAREVRDTEHPMGPRRDAARYILGEVQ